MRKKIAEAEEIGWGGPCVFFRRLLAALVVLCAVAAFSFEAAAQQQGVSSEDYLNRLEWRGILALPGELRFSLHDKAGQGGFWIGMGEVRAGVEVVSYDRKENEVTLRHGEATRKFALSSSSVAALEDEPHRNPPPVLRLGDGEEDESIEEVDVEESHVTALWRAAMAESPRLREIHAQFQALNRHEEHVAEALATIPPEAPEYPNILTRQNEVQQEKQALINGALNELRDSVGLGLSEEARNDLIEGLRTDLLSRLAPLPDLSYDSEEYPASDAREHSPEEN